MEVSETRTDASVWRAPGMPALLSATAAGFSGFAVMLPVAPLWVVHGGAGSGGAGAVNGMLMLFTVLTQPFVPRALRRFGWGPVMVAGMLLLGLPSLTHLVTDDLGAVLGLSAVRGLGFGVITVVGSAAVAELVEPARRGAAIGAYGLAIAGPHLLLLPAGPWLAEQVGFWVVFALGTLPVLGCLPALALGRHLSAPGGDEDGPPERRGPVVARLLRPMALLLGATVAGGALLTFAPQMVDEAALATGGLLVLTAAAALARWQIGGLADRHGAQLFLWPLVVLTVLGLGLTAYAVGASSVTQSVTFLVGTAVVGACYGALQNLTLVLSFHAVERRDYGVASAVWNIGFDAGTGLGAVVVGAVAAGFSFSTALLVAAGFSLATLPLALFRPR